MKACCRFLWRNASFHFVSILTSHNSAVEPIYNDSVGFLNRVLVVWWMKNSTPLHKFLLFFFDLWIRFVALPRTLTHSIFYPQPPATSTPTTNDSAHCFTSFSITEWKIYSWITVTTTTTTTLAFPHYADDVYRYWSWTHSARSEWQADADFPLLNSCSSLQQQFTSSQLFVRAFSITGVLWDAVGARFAFRFAVTKNEDDGKISSLLLMFNGDNFTDLPLSSVFAMIVAVERWRRARVLFDSLKGLCWAATHNDGNVDVDERKICSRMKLHAAIKMIKLMRT